MAKIDLDFVNTAEQMNIWMFNACTLIGVCMMMPEALYGPSEFNTELSLFASSGLIALNILWLTTQALWYLARKHVERQQMPAMA